jgi:hypothetical protein
MLYRIWRLSEYTPDNLGLAFTDDGLLLGHTPLIERREGRFVVREPSEIARLVMYSFPNGVAVDRLMPGLARVASALNANDQALARIAAVHLQIPDIPSPAKRNAMIAEDALIKYERDEGGVTGNNWNPALHPRTGTPPNPGWFAPVDDAAPSHGELRPRFAENVDPSRRTDTAPTNGQTIRPSPGNPMDEPATFSDRFGAAQQPSDGEFWSSVWPAIKSWLEEPVPEYDLESGKVVGERPRWHAIAPYLGISAATAAIFGIEAFAPTIAAWLGLGAGASVKTGPRLIGSFPVPKDLPPRTTTFGDYAHDEIAKFLQGRYPKVEFVLRVGRGQQEVDVEVIGQRSINTVGFRYAEIKPLTDSGRARFYRQVFNWDLSEPVQPITYDADGNVFMGFHK